MRARDYLGILIAILADSVQIGTTFVSLGTAQLLVPLQLLFVVGVTLVLGLLMGWNGSLLVVALEAIPGVNMLPSFTARAVAVAISNKNALRGNLKA